MLSPTIKLYENNSYLKDFTATILSCEEKNGEYLVVLDRTAFFPEGGGQAPDLGVIGNAQVQDVQIREDVIYHKVDSYFAVGAVAECSIDWDTRFVRMQNHSAEHLVSGTIHNLYGYNNVGFHMSKSFITLDVDGVLNDEDIKKIELAVNKAIYENSKINVIYPSAEDLCNYDYRSKLDITENVRLVRIEGHDLCACCAPHVNTLGEIGLIKILGFMPYKKGTRIEMAAGLLALTDYCQIHDTNKSIMSELSAKRDEIHIAVEKLHSDLGEAKSKINAISNELALVKMRRHSAGDMLCVFVEDADYNQLRFCVNSILSEAKYCCVLSKQADGYIYVTASEKKDIRPMVKDLNSHFNGRGGGKENYAQGKIVAKCDEEIASYFAFIGDGND